MRTEGCNIQQSLTPEATTVVKQAINLARRRGHAQVTPIHVASVMLASPTGLLRTACLKSNSHPLQCKALDLCFNVALNRLPTTSPAPILAPHSHYPALANALMAAFKRAQAHQRRGLIESQQQPILALKIETEQLVISILDDPSVSRVMREAGFSSTHVKSNVDHAVSSLEGCSQTTTAVTANTPVTATFNNNNINIKREIITNPIIFPSTHQNYQTQILSSFTQLDKPVSHPRQEDVSSVIKSWLKRREKSSIILIGECVTACESIAKGVKERIEKGDVPLELKYVQFLNCPLISMKNMSREEIDLKLGEIRCFLKGCVGRGVVLYLGDLKWVIEYWAYYGEQRRHYYCPVEHLIMGLRRLVFGNVEFGRLWLMGVATFSSYFKCKIGNPSLETWLDLHPLTIPHGSLDLSLKLDSSLEEQSKSILSVDVMSWAVDEENKVEMHLNCCLDCSTNCRQEARSLVGSYRNNESTNTTPTTSTSSSLPSWLQKYKDESRESSPVHNDQEETMQIKELCNKWNSICNSSHKSTTKFPGKISSSCSPSPSSSNSISSYDSNKKPSWPIMLEHQFLPSNITKDFFDPKPELLSNPNSIPNSTSSSETTEPGFENPKLDFKENTQENLDLICSALKKKAPWQKDIIPEIAMTILRVRSGMLTRKSKTKMEDVNNQKSETWLFFLGMDEEGKQKIAKELAKIIFGSVNNFKSIGVSNFSSTRADSTEEFKLKRTRDESGLGYLDRFAELVKENPHRVLFVEDFELIDQCSKKGIKRAIESGKMVDSEGETVFLEDAIVIFSCDSFSSGSRACSPPVKHKIGKEKEEDFDEGSNFGPLDLNICADYGDNCHDESLGDVKILESVDKQVFFKVLVL